MKAIVVFLCVFGLMSSFADTNAQNLKLDFQIEKGTVKDVLELIEQQGDLSFVYDNNVFNVNREISLKANNKSLDDVLKILLSEENLKYEKVNRFIIISADGFDAKQQITVSGTVTDQSGLPLPGVTVIVKGSTHGTITNADGNYSLGNVSGDATLVFSFVGMKKREVVVDSQTSINVILENETIGIEEVVAIGYGTMNRLAVTGAAAKANLEVYEKVPVTNIVEKIKGSIAGLNVSGIKTAGEVADITIRGQNSTEASNTPLIVVDGAIFNGSLADISPNDIENLTVLKDASAAAVYGSRSANGVIIIETQKGEGINGKPKFDVKLSYGISNQLEPLKTYNAEGYIQRLLDIRELNGLDADPDDIRIYLEEEELKNYDATSDHKPTLENPWDPFIQLGHNFNTTLSVSNSTDKSNYYIATSIIDQEGVVLNDKFNLISGRVNIDSDLTDWFTLGIKSFYSRKDYSGSSPSILRVTRISPYASYYNEDGSYKLYPQTNTSVRSPFSEIATEDTDIRNNLSGVISGVIKIPWVKGLSYQTTFSNTLAWTIRNEFYDENTYSGMASDGYGERRYANNYYMLLDNMVKYNRVFAEKHLVDVTLLYSREHSSWESMGVEAEGFDNTALGTFALENGSIVTAGTSGGETYGIGLMARASYTFNHKYSVTGTVRRDGYSAFSKNKKWGVFPSVGLNWNISKESFMDNIDPVENLALRISYGKNGNQSISAYETLARISYDTYFYNGDDSYTITQYISSLANNDLGWESTTGLNFGLDFNLLKHRINGSIDAYNTTTNDLMFDLSLPAISGITSITSNIGEIKNKGMEVSLNTTNIDKGDFKWYSDFAFSLNRNKVATIYGEDNDGDGIEDDLISDGYFIGKSLGTIYAYKVTGMWQQEDEDNGEIMSGLRPGDYKLDDVDGDGAISSDKDRQFIGCEEPNFRWSWTNTLKYKDISLMLFVYSIWGGNGRYLSGNNTPYLDAYTNEPNINHPVYDYWLPSNTDAKYPRPDYATYAAYTSTKYVDRSFIKLQKVALTYDISKMVKPWGINGMTLSLSADNLFTFAPHWEGLDPETNNGLKSNAQPSIRTYLFSVSLNF